jgi:hypothetical protein
MLAEDGTGMTETVFVYRLYARDGLVSDNENWRTFADDNAWASQCGLEKWRSDPRSDKFIRIDSMRKNFVVNQDVLGEVGRGDGPSFRP